MRWHETQHGSVVMATIDRNSARVQRCEEQIEHMATREDVARLEGRLGRNRALGRERRQGRGPDRGHADDQGFEPMSDTRFREHLRLSLLRMLEGAPGYTANSSILHQVVGDFGLSATRDQVKTELTWLHEQNLVRKRELEIGGLVVASLTDRGLDVAEGRASCPGVQRPSPRG